MRTDAFTSRGPCISELNVSLRAAPTVSLRNPHLWRPSSVQFHPPSAAVATRDKSCPTKHLARGRWHTNGQSMVVNVGNRWQVLNDRFALLVTRVTRVISRGTIKGHDKGNNEGDNEGNARATRVVT